MKYPAILLPEELRTQVKSHLYMGLQRIEKVIEQIDAMVIKDLRVHPHSMEFVGACDNTEHKPVFLRYALPDGTYTQLFSIHPHALGQLCGKVNVPRNFARMLSQKGAQGSLLLSHNLNELFYMDKWLLKDGGKIKFLHRIVEKELRGFISRRFNRHLMSGPMLHAFMKACEEAGAQPAYASSSDVRFRVKAVLPGVYEPIRKQYVSIGVEWSNSDFGAGALEVATFLWFPVQNRFITLGGYRRVHIGSVTESSDHSYEEACFSEETYRQEVATQSMAIRDAVLDQLSPQKIESLLDAVVDMYDEQISWTEISSKIKTVAGSAGVDRMKTAMDEGIEELPEIPKNKDGVPQPTKFWFMSACGWLAAKEDDADKRSTIESIGGSVFKEKQPDK